MYLVSGRREMGGDRVVYFMNILRFKFCWILAGFDANWLQLLGCHRDGVVSTGEASGGGKRKRAMSRRGSKLRRPFGAVEEDGTILII